MSKGAALITGASSGIGEELAKLCAADGYDLALVARTGSRLEELAAQLSKAHSVQAQAFPVDLADPEAREALFRKARGMGVEILINNAGFGLRGPYAETDWWMEDRMIHVNISAVAHLTKLFLPEMLKRRSGRILNVASTAAFVPGPFMSVYYASKAFVVSFSHAVANEVSGSGVTVTVLCPGPTDTRFKEAAGIADSPLFKGTVMGAAEVARIGYRGMMAGRVEVVAGLRNRVVAAGSGLLPRPKLAGIARKLNQ
jgi:short-subunit dehydrogenase